MPIKTSLDMVAGAQRYAAGAKVKRKDLQVGDLFRGATDGKVYMHTGCRSCPPSQRSVKVTIGSQVLTHELYTAQGRLPNGKDIIGWQSVVVSGSLPTGEDGANFTTNGERSVTVVGRGELTLHM